MGRAQGLGKRMLQLERQPRAGSGLDWLRNTRRPGRQEGCAPRGHIGDMVQELGRAKSVQGSDGQGSGTGFNSR